MVGLRGGTSEVPFFFSVFRWPFPAATLGLDEDSLRCGPLPE